MSKTRRLENGIIERQVRIGNRTVVRLYQNGKLIQERVS